MIRSARQHRGRRLGAMLPLIVLLLPMMIVFLGFAVDVAYMQLTRLELQAVTDAAARAASSTLSRTDSKPLAREAAVRIASNNRVAGKPLSLTNVEIEFGRSDRGADGYFAFKPGGKPTNSVRVTGDRTNGSKTGAVPLFFGQFFGTQGFEPQFVSTASFLNIDICLVLDRSSSMKGRGGAVNDCKPPAKISRWSDLDAAVETFLTTLEENKAEEHLALVTYAGTKGKLPCGQKPDSLIDTNMQADFAPVRKAMTNYRNDVWNGYTYIESGIRTGLGVLLDPDQTRSSADKLMILMTDGQENIGSALEGAKACAAAGIRVNTITFSPAANQELMKSVASATGGRHMHADNGAELIEVFREMAAQSSRLTQ